MGDVTFIRVQHYSLLAGRQFKSGHGRLALNSWLQECKLNIRRGTHMRVNVGISAAPELAITLIAADAQLP